MMKSCDVSGGTNDNDWCEVTARDKERGAGIEEDERRGGVAKDQDEGKAESLRIPG
jgi:hypothetical protein